MDQHPSSQASENSTQGNSSSYVAINSIRRLNRLLQELEELPVKPPSIYLDASGVGKDDLIDLQLLVLPTNTLYVVNVRRIGTTALSAVGDNSASLRRILESRVIPKVGFDIRSMSRLLFRQLNISLDGMYDLQLMELASRDSERSKKFLAGFAKCIDQDIPSHNDAKRRWLQPNSSTNMHQFNSLGHVTRETMRRVELFPALWTVYKRKLGAPDQAVWLHLARAESHERVQDSKTGPESQGRQHLGPEAWWNYKQKQAAIKDWNDWLHMEMSMGEGELNSDAEWVPTNKDQGWVFDYS